MNKKLLGLALAITFLAMLATPMVLAKPWGYPKNNDKFEEFGVTFGFDWTGFIEATTAATAGLEDANKVVVKAAESAVSYEIRIGEAGPGQRVYTLGEDFTYTGEMTYTVFDPVLPYEPFSNPPLSIFLAGKFHHFRVDYMYDFGNGDGGLDGTITMVALITGNTVFLSPDMKSMWITSLQGTGDFKNVNIKATAISPNHMGIVSGWPE